MKPVMVQDWDSITKKVYWRQMWKVKGLGWYYYSKELARKAYNRLLQKNE